MSDTKTLPTNVELASMNGYEIARALGCEYSGDSNVIDHGGGILRHP